MTKRQDISTIHRELYDYLKEKVEEIEIDTTKEFKTYKKDQLKASQQSFEISSYQSLEAQLRKSSVIFLGDFHSFDQSSRNALRLLRMLLKQNKKLTLGVEFIQQEHQELIQKFLSNNLTEPEFLDMIGYFQSWKFPWETYRVFFELAREGKLNLLALNTKGSLSKRDKAAAKKIVEFLKNNCNAVLLVQFGEYHIVKDKLPKQVEILHQGPLQYSIIHQNMDEVYWELEAKKLHKNPQVVQFSSNEFSLQSSPPWVKYESILYWYENLAEDPDFDMHEAYMENGILGNAEDAVESFLFIGQGLMQHLGLSIEMDKFEDFNLYDYHSLESVLEKIDQHCNKEVAHFYKKLITMDKGFKLPFMQSYFCPNYSLNRLTSLLGTHLLAIHFRKSFNEYEKNILSSDPFDVFLIFLHQHIVAYYCSKTVNPYRKCERFKDLEAIYEKELKISSDRAKVLNITLNIINLKDIKNTKSLLSGLEIFDLYRITKWLGQYMGELLYEREFSQEVIHPLFNKELKGEDFLSLLETLFEVGTFETQRKGFF